VTLVVSQFERHYRDAAGLSNTQAAELRLAGRGKRAAGEIQPHVGAHVILYDTLALEIHRAEIVLRLRMFFARRSSGSIDACIA